MGENLPILSLSCLSLCPMLVVTLCIKMWGSLAPEHWEKEALWISISH